MADPISITSGLLTLVTFSVQSSKTLYDVVQSFKSNRKTIRELREELEALENVLQALQQAAEHNHTEFEALKTPVLRCGNACTDCKKILLECSSHSSESGSRSSFRDWARFKYMGYDIAGFKDMLAGYKSTISIALGGATLRTSTITVGVLHEYQKMISNTSSDLEEHLEDINQRLQALTEAKSNRSGEIAVEQQQIQHEIESTKQCLDICAQATQQMNQLQAATVESDRDIGFSTHHIMAPVSRIYIPSKKVTNNTFRQCQDALAHTVSELEQNLLKMNSASDSISHEFPNSDRYSAQRRRIQEEKTSLENCLGICSDASRQADQVRMNVVEDVTATDDSHQIVVATLGDLISARRITAGARSSQWLGQMSDLTLQQLSKDRETDVTANNTRPPSN
ncbi:MAG: hypothetical protein M1828_002554 [Chrysothrix sp. TS-e1954]|nr:MAG: hypothetical protein M1828_002554 [Chrysothrix sp. TS-e1954]